MLDPSAPDVNGGDATEQDPSAAGVRVWYIAGLGRSGSTVLDQVLGSLPGFFSAGELNLIWHTGVLLDARCACGERFSSCPFWNRVRRLDPELFTRETATRVTAYQSEVFRSRRLHRLWSASGRRRILEAAPADYLGVIRRLYRSIAEASGGRLIVDSSKHPVYAYLLTRAGAAQSVEMVHLVRDPRAVAFSLMRRKAFLGLPDGAGQLDRYPPLKTAMLWIEWNTTIEHTARVCGLRRRLLRYEDFAGDPNAWLNWLCAGRPGAMSWGTTDGVMPRGDLHTVSGNPSRMLQGPIHVKVDDEWRSRMRRSDRVAVTVATAPALRRYSYRLWSTPSRIA